MVMGEGDEVGEALILRFVGEDSDGQPLRELRAAHVAEVLQGVVGLTSDFAKARVFGDGPAGSEVVVRPAREGSFIIECLRWVQDNPDTVAFAGVPSIGQVIWWATKSARADVSDFEYLENDTVKVYWQDGTVQEIPAAAWQELQKRKRRRKKQLRAIMAPLSDPRVTALEVQTPETPDVAPEEVEADFVLTRPDYDAVRPEDEIEESDDTFEVEAQMSAIDFDNPERWRVKTKESNRAATVEDEVFLGRVARGLAIRKADIFQLRIREDRVEKNGRTRRTWTVVKVVNHRRSVSDDEPDP